MTIKDKLVVTLGVKDFRHLLTEEVQPCAVNFWKHKLNADINKAHWESVFKSTKETRLRVLHWKVLHNIYPTNILLHKMGIETSAKCNACNVDEKDYIEHFFFECSKIKPIWKLVENEIHLKTNQTIKIDKSTALLGHHDEAMSSTDLNTINHLIAIAKMCISKFRYGEIKQIKLIFEKEMQLRDNTRYLTN